MTGDKSKVERFPQKKNNVLLYECLRFSNSIPITESIRILHYFEQLIVIIRAGMLKAVHLKAKQNKRKAAIS